MQFNMNVCISSNTTYSIRSRSTCSTAQRPGPLQSCRDRKKSLTVRCAISADRTIRSSNTTCRSNIPIDIVLKLNVSLETIKKRILERKSIEKRADDNEDIVIKRFQTYEISPEPVLNYYKQTKLLQVVNGENSISQINNEISGLIDSIKG